ncbi:MAG: hypothetical protein K0U98_22410 [Deltaproteobacteria bacterium]|nr:hypothetical protein [Deltaproteobacteria bacterium]
MSTPRQFLADMIDFAGLFPPAKLEMKPAVELYSRYRASAESWMLGRFVVPASRLEELEAAAEGLLPDSGSPPWELSVLAGANPDKAAAALAAFRKRQQDGPLRLGSIEAIATSAQDIRHAQQVLPQGIPIFFEIPVDQNPEPLVKELARAGGLAKIRTGGVTADAFPSVSQVAAFLRACAHHSVAFKATAGLHHPLRGLYRLTYETDSDLGDMFGFLNIFLAASFIATGALDERELTDLLVEADPANLTMSSQGIRWRDHQLSIEGLSEIRQHFAMSYGSCSFEEPVDDLKGLSFL